MPSILFAQKAACKAAIAPMPFISALIFMNRLSHLIAGAMVFLPLSAYVPPGEFLPCAAFCLLGSIFPDIDHRESKISAIVRKIAIAFLFLAALAIYFEKPILQLGIQALAIGIFAVIATFAKPRHRGITHSLIAAFAFSALAYFASGMLETVAVAAAAGYLSHLLLDFELKIA
jgi:membrane-bound metal-dependent hydrolase YbcI (DUF457 family)